MSTKRAGALQFANKKQISTSENQQVDDNDIIVTDDESAVNSLILCSCDMLLADVLISDTFDKTPKQYMVSLIQ